MRGYAIGRCSACRHVYVPFAGSDADLQRAYEQQFFRDGAYHDYLADREIAAKNFRRFAEIVRRHSPRGRLLEVGCAYGFFLDIARDWWTVTGIDIHAPGITHARDRLGADAVHGDFLDFNAPDASFDAVVMWDTIEHLRRPSAYIAKIAATLKPGGIVALTTGDVGSLVARLRGRRWRLYDPPFHLQYFTRETMTRLLAQHGLQIVELRTVGYDRSLHFMLHRLFRYGRGPASTRVFDLSSRLVGAASSFYLNVFDIMMVVARKTGDPSAVRF